MPAKRTEPSRSALNPAHGFKYTPSHSTNLAKKFAEIRRAAAKAEREAQAASLAAGQPELELSTGIQVVALHRKAHAA